MKDNAALATVAADLPPAPNDALAKPSPEPLTITSAKQRLEAKLEELQTTDIKEIPRLTIDIQRLRVALMILKERESKETNPNVYREMSLLTRMIKQTDLDGDTDEEREQRAQTASDKLEKAGVTAAGARAVIEIFRKMGHGGIPDDDEIPEPVTDDLPGGDGEGEV